MVDTEPRDDTDSVDIDLGASAQQVGLIETGGGVQHGLMEAAIAVVIAVVLTPILRGVRRWFAQ